MAHCLVRTTNNPPGTIPQVLMGGRATARACEAAPPGPAAVLPAAVPSPGVPCGLNFSNSGADQLHTYWYGDRHRFEKKQFGSFHSHNFLKIYQKALKFQVLYLAQQPLQYTWPRRQLVFLSLPSLTHTPDTKNRLPLLPSLIY